MPFNGSGAYNLPSPESPAVSGTAITASDRNTIDTDIATALSNTITKDGQTTITANIPFNSKKITNLADGSADTDAATVGNLNDAVAGVNPMQYGAVGDGSTDDTTAVQNCLNDGKPIKDDGRYTYRITTKLTVPSTGKIIITGHLRLRPDNGITCLEIQQTQSASTTLAADSRTGRQFIDVTDASSISAGDTLTVVSDEVWPYDNDTGAVFKGETNRVLSKSTNRLDLIVPANCAYNLPGETVTVTSYTPREVYIEGLEIEFASQASGNAGLSVEATDSTFANIRIKNASTGISLGDNSFNNLFVGCQLVDCFFTGLGYGIQINGASMTTITGCNFYHNRRGVDFSGAHPSHGGVVTGCQSVGDDGEGSCFGTHGAASKIVFSGNTALNGAIAFQIRSPLTSVIGNHAFGCGTFCTISANGLYLADNYMSLQSAGPAFVPDGDSAYFLEFTTIEGEDNDLWVNWAPYIIKNNVCTIRNSFIRFNTGISKAEDLVVEDNYIWLWNNSSGTAVRLIESVDANTADSTVRIGSNDIRVKNGTYSRFSNFTYDDVVTLANDATPSVLSVPQFGLAKTGGTTTVTDFDDGHLGQQFTLRFDHATTITDGSNILLSGSTNFVGAAGDTLTLRMINDQIWEEIGRKVN